MMRYFHILCFAVACSSLLAADEITTTFTYTDTSATTVEVAGEFSNWKTVALTKDASGTWTKTMYLKAGQYGYKFVVNGEWKFDPNNSARKSVYEAYYRPNNYVFEDIVESLKIVRSFGGWASINYFVFPGMTDSVEEYEALRKLIIDTDLTMIQWRNFNIDPDWYMGKIGATDTGEFLGVKQLMDLIAEEFPQVKFGYFNPPIERIKGRFEADFAH